MTTQENDLFVKAIERIIIIQFGKANIVDAVLPSTVIKTTPKSLESLEERIAWLEKAIRDMVATGQNKTRADRNKAFVTAIEQIINEDMELGRDKIATKEFWKRIEARGIQIPHNVAGEILRSMGIVPTNSKCNYYSYALIWPNQRESA
jgi:hypothetical protein